MSIGYLLAAGASKVINLMYMLNMALSMKAMFSDIAGSVSTANKKAEIAERFSSDPEINAIESKKEEINEIYQQLSKTASEINAIENSIRELDMKIKSGKITVQESQEELAVLNKNLQAAKEKLFIGKANIKEKIRELNQLIIEIQNKYKNRIQPNSKMPNKK